MSPILGHNFIFSFCVPVPQENEKNILGCWYLYFWKLQQYQQGWYGMAMKSSFKKLLLKGTENVEIWPEIWSAIPLR